MLRSMDLGALMAPKDQRPNYGPFPHGVSCIGKERYLMSIISYEALCKALKSAPSTPEYTQAQLILCLQDYMTNCYQWSHDSDWDFNLDYLLKCISQYDNTSVSLKDVISKLIYDTEDAVRYISDNMRSKIIRENVVQPIYKTREINSRGLIWLSRKPGRTIKEKLVNTNHTVMAVRHPHSFDTGENRLFIEFLRQMTEMVDIKPMLGPKSKRDYTDGDFAAKAFNITHDPDLSQIRRWENLQPNNTLLSDRNYQKIWRAFNELKEIDDIVKHDALNVDQISASMFFLLSLSELRRFVTIAQAPVVFDYRTRHFGLKKSIAYGFDLNTDKCTLELNDKLLRLTRQQQSIEAEFRDGKLYLSGDNELIAKLKLSFTLPSVSQATSASKEDLDATKQSTAEAKGKAKAKKAKKAQAAEKLANETEQTDVLQRAEQNLNASLEVNNDALESQSNNIILDLCIGSLKSHAKSMIDCLYQDQQELNHDLSEIEVTRASLMLIDPFLVRPLYYDKQLNIANLPGRLLVQKHTMAQQSQYDQASFTIPCDRSQAIELEQNVDSLSVMSALQSGDFASLCSLVRLLGQYISTQELSFLFPDKVDAFELSMLHKALRRNYPNALPFPRSMGAAFYLMQKDSFMKSFALGDFLVVVDQISDTVSLTLVQSGYDEKIAYDLPTFDGLIWERHPTTTASIKDKVSSWYRSLSSSEEDDIQEIFNLLDLSGLESEADKLTVFIKDRSYKFSKQDVHKCYAIDVKSIVEKFVNDHLNIIVSKNVHIISLSSKINYSGKLSFLRISYDHVLKGLSFYNQIKEQTKHVLWKDHLPKLGIKRLYGEFNLVNNQTIQPTFNSEVIIPVHGEFTLPKGKKEYHFELVSNDLNQKTKYAAVIRHRAFPLSEDVPCKMRMSYTYGAEDPYKLVLMPISKPAPFVEAQVAWEVMDEHNYLDLPIPQALKPISWHELRHHRNIRTNQDEDFVQKIVDYFDDVAKGYETCNLRKEHIERYSFGTHRGFHINYEKNGETYRVKFLQHNQDHSKVCNPIDFNNPGIVSFQLGNKTNSSLRRHRLTLSINSYKQWNTDKNGQLFYIDEVVIEGKRISLGFFQRNFIDPSQVHIRTRDVSFCIDMQRQEKDNRFQEGRYYAELIHDESTGPYKRVDIYEAKDIREGNLPPGRIYNGFSVFMFNLIFGSGNSPVQEDAPLELKEAFYNAKDELLRSYEQCTYRYVSKKLLKNMALIGPALGAPYYKIVKQNLDIFLKSPKDHLFTSSIGQSLGDATDPHAIKLLKRITNELSISHPEHSISLLSKAVWTHPDFVMNVDTKTLFYYLNLASKLLEEAYLSEKITNYSGDFLSKTITSCLEYILAILRLRSLDEHDIKIKLSLIDPDMQRIYQCIEFIVSEVITKSLAVKTHLKLDIKNKGAYENVPDLLYAVLFFITGYNSSSDINITGLSLDENDE